MVDVGIQGMNRNITAYIVIHCSDTPPSMDIGAKEIRQWHITDNKWADIGYHFVIRRDGIRETGREINAIGSHVKGFNSCSVGVCLVGGKGGNNFTRPQWVGLEKLVKELRILYPKSEVVGHCDLNSVKTCPNFKVSEWLERIGD